MLLIKTITEKIEDELDDAYDYAELAIQNQDSHHALADVYMRLSESEMDHANKLHDAVVKVIEEHRDKRGTPPPAMQAVYDYLHEKQVEHSAEIKAIQSLYKR